MLKSSSVIFQADQLVAVRRTELSFTPLSLMNNVEAQLSVTSDLDAIEHEWRWFEQHADCTPFQTFDWLATWQRCIGATAGVNPAIVTGRRSNGELLFILPLAIERTRFSRRLVFLGRALCDYNAPLLAPEFPDRVGPVKFAAWWRAAHVRVLQTQGYQHDVVLLDKMPERVNAQANPLLALATMLNPSGAYLTCLSKDWESFYAAKRSPSTRRRDRTKRRKLAEGGELRFVTPKKPTDLQSTLNTLFSQKSRSFGQTGVPDLFALPGHSEFFTTVATKARGMVHVSRLDVGSKCAAVNLGLMYRGCYYHILASYDDGPLARFGPGAQHLRELMRYAIVQGCNQFDFTIGDEPYKREWADIQLKLYDHIAGTHWFGWVAAAQLILNLRAKRFVKNSPVLWALTSKLRSLIGSIKSMKRGKAADT